MKKKNLNKSDIQNDQTNNSVENNKSNIDNIALQEIKDAIKDEFKNNSSSFNKEKNQEFLLMTQIQC